MPKRVKIVPHLSVSQLQAKYRAAKSPVMRSQYQIVWLLATGQKTEAVAQMSGYSVQWSARISETLQSSRN